MAPLNRVKTNEKGNSKKNYDKCKEHLLFTYTTLLLLLYVPGTGNNDISSIFSFYSFLFQLTITLYI